MRAKLPQFQFHHETGSAVFSFAFFTILEGTGRAAEGVAGSLDLSNRHSKPPVKF